MKVIIYVNWREEEVITEKEYKEKLEEMKTDKKSFERYVSDYLSDDIESYLRDKREPLCYASVFNLTEKERKEIIDGMREGFKNQVEEDFSEEWEDVEIEV
jgi:hypothetical protein